MDISETNFSIIINRVSAMTHEVFVRFQSKCWFTKEEHLNTRKKQALWWKSPWRSCQILHC